MNLTTLRSSLAAVAACLLVALLALPTPAFAKEGVEVPVRQTVEGDKTAKTEYTAQGNGSSVTFTLTGDAEGSLLLSTSKPEDALQVPTTAGDYTYRVTNNRNAEAYIITVRVAEGSIKELAVSGPDGMKAEAIHFSYQVAAPEKPAPTTTEKPTTTTSEKTTEKKVTTTTARTTRKVVTTTKAVKARKVNTGDPTHLALWLGIGAAALIGLGLTFVLLRRRDNDETEKEDRT